MQKNLITFLDEHLLELHHSYREYQLRRIIAKLS